MTPGGGGHALADALGYPVPGEPSRLVRSLRAAVSTAPASAVLARTLRPADALLSRWGAARTGASGLLVGLPVVTLTTTGARSGLPRTVPLIPVVTEAAFAVLGTNFGGERTPAWVLNLEAHPEASIAFAGRDLRVLPKSVLYDPELTLTLPAGLSATSGINALAHAVEGLYAPDATPIVSLMAEEGARALVAALPRLVADGADLEARADAQYGAWLCGAVLAATTMSLHHKLCHTLGGTLDLPHAQTHTVVLPHALAYNAPAAPDAVTALSRALGGADDPARALWELAGRLGAPRSLAELGMAEDDIPRIAELAVAGGAGAGYRNPRPVTREGVEVLLRTAWAGDAPSALRG